MQPRCLRGCLPSLVRRNCCCCCCGGCNCLPPAAQRRLAGSSCRLLRHSGQRSTIAGPWRCICTAAGPAAGGTAGRPAACQQGEPTKAAGQNLSAMANIQTASRNFTCKQPQHLHSTFTPHQPGTLALQPAPPPCSQQPHSSHPHHPSSAWWAARPRQQQPEPLLPLQTPGWTGSGQRQAHRRRWHAPLGTWAAGWGGVGNWSVVTGCPCYAARWQGLPP